MSVSCRKCGQTWPRDPRLEVPCPSCPAPIGRRCHRPSGHNCEFHIPREQLAIDAGFLSEDCPAMKKEKLNCHHPDTVGQCTSPDFCKAIGKCRFGLPKQKAQTSPRLNLKLAATSWDAL